MAEINITITPEPDEIIQGQRSNTKRPEADRVSEIAGLMSATTQFAILPEGSEVEAEDEGEDEGEGEEDEDE
jgi:hypothetical protein